MQNNELPEMMQWLQGRLHVPQIVVQCREQGYDYQGGWRNGMF